MAETRRGFTGHEHIDEAGLVAERRSFDPHGKQRNAGIPGPVYQFPEIR